MGREYIVVQIYIKTGNSIFAKILTLRKVSASVFFLGIGKIFEYDNNESRIFSSLYDVDWHQNNFLCFYKY